MSNTLQQEGHSNARSTKQLQRFYLERLRNLVTTRQEQGAIIDPTGAELRLLDRAVYSTFCDCLDLGAGEEARSILRGEEPSPRPGRS